MKIEKNVPDYIDKKANDIIQSLEEGVDYQHFFGKRLNKNRSFISIRLSRNYRILCRLINGEYVPVLVSDHDKYDDYVKHITK